MNRFRAIRLRTLLVGSLLISVGMVAAHVPLRWEGDRTGQIADIPLRPLRAEEAAALMSNDAPLAKVVRLTRNRVVIRTGVFLLPPTGHAESWPSMTFRGRAYDVVSSSWENYHNVHSLDRALVERALGRKIGANDVDPGYLADSRASFSSNLLLAYFCIDVAFLAVLQIGILAILRRVRQPLLIPPLVFLTGGATALLVGVYSPAFVDADWFYQRIAVEELIGGRGPLGVSFGILMTACLRLSLACVPLYALVLAIRGIRRITGLAASRAWFAVSIVLGGAFLTQMAIEHQRYRDERERASATFVRLEALFRTPHLVPVKSDPALLVHETELLCGNRLSPRTRTALDSLFATAPPAHELRIFVPLHDRWHLFLWKNTKFRYADVRRIDATIDHDAIEKLLRTGEARDPSFGSYLESTYLAGQTFRGSDGRIMAIALVGPGEQSLDARSFWWWRRMYTRW